MDAGGGRVRTTCMEGLDVRQGTVPMTLFVVYEAPTLSCFCYLARVRRKSLV